jgi:hypothetical protein
MAARLTVRPCASLNAHPQWSQADFEYFRGRGYFKQQILEFWNRNLRLGCRPLHWHPDNPKYQDALRRITRR